MTTRSDQALVREANELRRKGKLHMSIHETQGVRSMRIGLEEIRRALDRVVHRDGELDALSSESKGELIAAWAISKVCLEAYAEETA